MTDVEHETDLPPDPETPEHTRQYSVVIPGHMVEGENASEAAWRDYYRRWCTDLGLHPIDEPTIELRPQEEHQPDWAAGLGVGNVCWVATGWVY